MSFCLALTFLIPASNWNGLIKSFPNNLPALVVVTDPTISTYSIGYSKVSLLCCNILQMSGGHDRIGWQIDNAF